MTMTTINQLANKVTKRDNHDKQLTTTINKKTMTIMTTINKKTMTTINNQQKTNDNNDKQPTKNNENKTRTMTITMIKANSKNQKQ